MFEGDLEEGELEIGQVSALLDSILPAGEIVKNVWKEFMNGLAESGENALILIICVRSMVIHLINKWSHETEIFFYWQLLTGFCWLLKPMVTRATWSRQGKEE